MKLKLLISILVAAALLAVVLWRVDRFVYGDRMAWAEAQSRAQISSLTQATNVEIQSARRMLATVSNDTFKRERTNWKAFQPYYALALMTSQGGTLGVSRMVSKADSPAASWTANEFSQYIGFMGKELESRGTVLLRSFKDPAKRRHVAVIFAGGGNAYILIGSGENFQSLIESQKGSVSSISIIASDGLTISHATPDYVGTVMSDSTMLKEIRNTGAAQGLGQYMQGKQQIFGMYSQIPGTNSYVISTVPIEELMKGRLSLAWQFVFMAVGICLIGAAAYFWQEKRAAALPSMGMPASMPPSANPMPVTTTATNIKAPPPQRQPVAPSLPAPPPTPAVQVPFAAPPAPGPVVVHANSDLPAPPAPLPRVPAAIAAAAISPQELQAEKTEAYRQVAAALGQEMRSPLASILGFSQMVLAKTQDPDVVQAVESILREARSSRDVLEKLVTFTGEHSTEKTAAKIEGPITQALKNLEGKITQKGVKVQKEFKETAPWPMATADLVKAFENVFVNAIEAMERMPEKVLSIKAWEADDGLHVTVSDTGEGIDVENTAKVFDPFFTTRSFAQHVGLGLPVVVGILKEHNGTIQMQSQRGKGTQVEIVFKPNAVAAAVMPAPKGPPPMRAPELPADLPKAPPTNHEEVAAVMKEAEVPKEKLVDVNVDSLLELPEEEAPLQFLDGHGFAEEPAPSLPPSAPPLPSSPAKSLPPGPPPIAGKPPAFVEPTEVDAEPSIPEPVSKALAEESTAETSVVIDKPSAPPMMVQKTGLDSYKVEVRRPGKRN